MGAVGVGELGQAGAVEIDAVILCEVRILAGQSAAGREEDLAILFIDVLDISHQPVALCDLILHSAGNAVVEVEVFPAATLRRPDDLLAIVDVVAILPAGGEPGTEVIVVEEGLY